MYFNYSYQWYYIENTFVKRQLKTPTSMPLSNDRLAERQQEDRISTNLLLRQSKQLLLGFLHLLYRTSDGDFIDPRALSGKVDMHAATFLHDRSHKPALWPNQGVVQLWGNGYLFLCNVCLDTIKKINKHVWDIDSYAYLPNFKRKTNKKVNILTSSFWMAKMRIRASSQFAFFPVMTIISELLFSAGRSIFVLVSSRIWKTGRSNQTLTALIQKHQFSFKHTVPSWYSIHLSQLCFCGTAWRWEQRQKSCSPPEMRFCFKLMLDHTNINKFAKSFMIQSQSKITCKIGFTISATIFCMNFAHFSTSVLGPLSWTMSLFCAGSGKLMMTWNK